MKTKTLSYIERLRETYEFYGDEKSILQIDEAVRSYDKLNEMREFRELPMVKKIVDAAITRYKSLAYKLTHDRKLTEAERLACFVGIDWAQWYISALGGDLNKAEKEIEDSIEVAAERAGLK